MIYGAIDIGTNAARLLIGQVVEQNGHTRVKKISYTRVPLRLGFEVFESGTISKEKENQFIKTMKAFKLLTEVFDVKGLRACATSAMREASNGIEIKNRIKKKTGIDIEIIGGEEEAEVIFSTFSLIQFDQIEPYVVIDVGGGSTEISIFRDGKREESRSFEIGTIRMLKDKVKDKNWEVFTSWISKTINDKKIKVFSTGGNINKIHKVLGLKYMQPLRLKDISKLYDELNPLNLDERMDLYQLKPDRADVIVPAAKIYMIALEAIGAKQTYVPKIGLSDGMIFTMYLKDHK